MLALYRLLAVTAFTAIAIFTSAIPAQAAVGVPKSISYQGRLYDSSGNLLGGTGTSYCFKFSIWDGPTVGSGTKLWPTTLPVAAQLNVRYGVFNANIGINTPDALTFDFNQTDTSFLQVEVAPFAGSCGTFETITPRFQLTAAGYAINAGTVAGAAPGTGISNVLKLDTSGNIGLTATNPQVSASGTNTLTLQGAATGNLQFFSASNSLTSAGNLTIAGTYNSNTLTASTFTFGAASAATIQSAAGQNLTLDSGTTGALGIGTSANAKAISLGNITGATSVTIKSGTGGISIGDDGISKTVTIGNLSAAISDTINIATNTAASQIINIGSAAAGSALTIEAGSSASSIQIGNGATAHGIQIGTGAAIQTVSVGSSTAGSRTSLNGATNTTSTSGVIIGAVDANQVNLVLDNSSTLSETASTCSTVGPINTGALYYNTASGSIRGCINGGWEDVVSSAGLGIMLFGIVPDSGTNPGDIGSTTTAGVSGPCKVSWASASTVTVQPCIAYSGGRKTVVTGTTLTITTTKFIQWQNVCLNSSGQAVLLGTGTTESNAPDPVFAPNAPVLCLAEIFNSGSASLTIAQIYDTRTYTTSEKTFVNTSAAFANGQLASVTTTDTTKVTQPATASIGNLRGVIVASNSAAWASGGPNAIMAVSGEIYVKATAGAVNSVNYVIASTTAGYTTPSTTASTNAYGNLGIVESAFGSCGTPSAATCQGSVLSRISLR